LPLFGGGGFLAIGRENAEGNFKGGENYPALGKRKEPKLT